MSEDGKVSYKLVTRLRRPLLEEKARRVLAARDATGLSKEFEKRYGEASNWAHDREDPVDAGQIFGIQRCWRILEENQSAMSATTLEKLQKALIEELREFLPHG